MGAGYLLSDFIHVCGRYGRAKLALQKGEENLAREALKRRKDYEVEIDYGSVVTI